MPSRVFSNNLVLPEPGELIRFRQSVPCRRNRSRSSAAIRSFSFKILLSSSTWFMLLDLDIREFQLISADELRLLLAALRAAKIVVSHGKLGTANRTAMASSA